MNPMTCQAVENMSAAIRETDEYQKYRLLREMVMEDETNRALLKEYQKAQTALQMAAMTGKEADEETVQRFSKLSGLLYMNQDVAQYLLAQMHLQKLMGEVFQELTKAANLDLELPGI